MIRARFWILSAAAFISGSALIMAPTASTSSAVTLAPPASTFSASAAASPGQSRRFKSHSSSSIVPSASSSMAAIISSIDWYLVPGSTFFGFVFGSVFSASASSFLDSLPSLLASNFLNTAAPHSWIILARCWPGSVPSARIFSTRALSLLIRARFWILVAANVSSSSVASLTASAPRGYRTRSLVCAAGVPSKQHTTIVPSSGGSFPRERFPCGKCQK